LSAIFNLERFENQMSPKVAVDGLEAARDGCWRSGLGFEAREGRFYALAAAIRAGTPTRVIARLILYASAVRLNSPRTFSSRRIRNAP
jgi:hypothetical protein